MVLGFGFGLGFLNFLGTILFFLFLFMLFKMLFRGMLLSRLSRSMSPAWAILVQAVVFASIHLLDPSAIAALPGLVIVGAVLGYAAMRTGNLALPIMMHAGVNLTAVILLIFGSNVMDWLEQAADPALIRVATSILG